MCVTPPTRDVAKKNISMQNSLYLDCERSTIREHKEIGAVLITGSKPLSPKNAISNHTSLIFARKIYGGAICIGNSICVHQHNGKFF